MLQKTRLAGPIAAVLFAIGIPLSAQAVGPYQQTGAQIQARQRVADLTQGPRQARNRASRRPGRTGPPGPRPRAPRRP